MKRNFTFKQSAVVLFAVGVLVSQKTNAQTIIYSQDFSAGIPATWTQTSTPAAANWAYRGPSTTPNVTVGSRGAYATPNSPIVSPTASNGFIIFDSDYLSDGGTPGGTGAPSPHKGILTTDAINCSGEPYLKLNFHQFIRQFSSYMIVAISTNGSTYTNVDTVSNAVTTNAETSNNDSISIDISSIAGNQSSVYLRFIYDGTQQLPGTLGGTGYYFWMIDDISLVTIPPNQLMVNSSIVNFSRKNGFYTNTPLVQVTPMQFSGVVSNIGTVTQTNVVLTANISGASAFNQSSSSTSLSYKQEDTLNINSFFTPKLGNYSGNLSVTQNQTDIDTAQERFYLENFSVSGTIYARDNGNINNHGSIGTDYTGSEEGMTIDNLFEVITNGKADAISVFIDSIGTDIGAQITGQLLDSSQLNPLSTPIIMSESIVHTIVAADLNHWITLRLPSTGNNVLDTNVRYYYAALRIKPGTGNVYVANDVTTPQPTFTGEIYLDSAGRWYTPLPYYSNAPFIRLITACFTVNSTTTNELCFGDANGNAKVIATGTTGPFTYTWSTGSSDTLASVSNTLSANIYTVTVTDHNGCTLVDSITVMQPLKVMASFSSLLLAHAHVSFSSTSLGATIYMWNFGDGVKMTGGDTISHTYTSTGTFTVKLVVSNADGCSDSTTNQVTINSLAGINPLSDPLKSITVYPNPANNLLNIEAVGNNIKQIYLINVLGQTLISNLNTSGISNLDVSALPEGLYLLKIQTDNGWTDKKINIVR